jgi:predicted MFS family arabinose efflux permease
MKARLPPLVLATMTSQALLVVLSPTLVAIARDLDVSVGLAGQARSITAVVAVATSLAIVPRVEAVGVRRLLAVGAQLALAGCAAVAAAPSIALFLLAHVLVGLGFACLLSAGFAGVAAFPEERRPWAMGHVAGANALAWIIVNPVVGVLTDEVSWRWAEAVPALMALAALAAARFAAAPAGTTKPPRIRSLVAHAGARRWLASEMVAFGS